MTTSNLPFDLTVESTAEWLQSLSQLISTSTANQLNKVIQQLRKDNAETDKVLSTLLQLTPTVLYISKSIETSLLADKDSQQSTKSRKIGKLCIQLLRNVSLAFCEFADNDALPIEDQNQSLYISLQFIGYTQRITVLFHQFPSTRLWQKTGELYTIAVNRKLGEQEIKHKIKDFKNLPTINSVLKRNLLFSLFSPYQYKSNVIRELFLLSQEQAHFLQLNSIGSKFHLFLWIFSGDNAPGYNNNLSYKSDTTVYINTSELLTFITSKSFKPSTAINSILDNIINQLSGFKEVFKTPSATELIIYNMIVGHTEINSYLEKLGKRNKIQQLSLQLDGTSPEDDITIEPMEYEKNYSSQKLNLTATNSKVDLPHSAQAVKILLSTYNQYIIAIANMTDCSIGDIVLLQHSDVNTELGVIRQIKNLTASNSTHLLIEKLQGVPSFQQIKSTDNVENIAVLLRNKNSPSELILPPSKYYNGTTLELTSEETVTLDKLVDYSSYFMRYRLC